MVQMHVVSPVNQQEVIVCNYRFYLSSNIYLLHVFWTVNYSSVSALSPGQQEANSLISYGFKIVLIFLCASLRLNQSKSKGKTILNSEKHLRYELASISTRLFQSLLYISKNQESRGSAILSQLSRGLFFQNTQKEFIVF